MKFLKIFLIGIINGASIFLTLFIAWFLAGYLPAFIMTLFNLK